MHLVKVIFHCEGYPPIVSNVAVKPTRRRLLQGSQLAQALVGKVLGGSNFELQCSNSQLDSSSLYAQFSEKTLLAAIKIYDGQAGRVIFDRSSGVDSCVSLNGVPQGSSVELQWWIFTIITGYILTPYYTPYGNELLMVCCYG